MKTKQRIPGFNDMLFEKRNKAYGAYELRTNYNSRLTKSLVITISVLILIILYYIFSRKIVPKDLAFVSHDTITFSQPFIFNQSNIFQKQSSPAVESNGFKKDDLSFKISNDTIEKQKIDSSITSTPTGDTATASSSSSGNSDTSNAKTFALNVNPNGIPNDSTFSQSVVDKIPEFPGGIEAFYKYLTNRISYSEEALRFGIKGRLYVSFVIDEEGLVRNVKFLNNLGFGLDESVKQVLIKSPQWTPGFYGDKAVKTEMRLPVSFNLKNN